jgi:sugar (pentulose or hexulose) kinase
MSLYLGIDIGTSGVRTSVIKDSGHEVSSAAVRLPAPDLIDKRPCQDPMIWWEAVGHCLRNQAMSLRDTGHHLEEITALAIDGTSGTLLLTDENLRPLTPGFLYHSGNFTDEAKVISEKAPQSSIARGAGSTLARLLFLKKKAPNARYALHQADWIAARLMKHGGLSDETNVLKMGYDVESRVWPDWVVFFGGHLLPKVKPVGGLFGALDDSIAKTFGFARDVKVVAGTTDSNAAFLASGASKVGEGVTSLGTTLAVKLLSRTPISDPSRGVYSHRIKDMWLPGGASNSGGGVLLNFFTPEQMTQMESSLNPGKPTGLNYYPLSQQGERFPIADPKLEPRLSPRPQSDIEFFQAMLEGISEIERIGYATLEQLGAPSLQRVFTSGGGARNQAWTEIRSSKLGLPIEVARSSNASAGVARIAAGLI